MNAILFGSIGSIVESSEIQRQAFNQAFEQHDLGWNWSKQSYAKMLEDSGGRNRIANYAKAKNADVDVDAIYQAKCKNFEKLMQDGNLQPRPGVVEIIGRAKKEGIKLGFVTSTSKENRALTMDAVNESISESDFDVIVDLSVTEDRKPLPTCYEVALEKLGCSAMDALAIENNADGLTSANEAGIRCIVVAGEFNEHHVYKDAHLRMDELNVDVVFDQFDAKSFAG